MPVYEYESAEHDIHVELRFPAGEKPDEIVLRRRTVPSHVTVGVGAKPPTMGQKIGAGLKKLEADGQLKIRPGDPSVAELRAATKD